MDKADAVRAQLANDLLDAEREYLGRLQSCIDVSERASERGCACACDDVRGQCGTALGATSARLNSAHVYVCVCVDTTHDRPTARR